MKPLKQSPLLQPKDKEMALLAAKLCKLFVYIGKKESTVEHMRQKLCHDTEFEPRALFMRIAGEANCLSAERLHAFTQLYPGEDTCKLPISLELCYTAVKSWEGRKDQGYLSLTDFNQIVLTHEQSGLRAEVTQRPTIEGKQSSKRIEMAFCDLFRLEFDLLATSERIKHELEHMKGYSVCALFEMIDKPGYKFLTPAAIFSFLVRHSAGNLASSKPTENRMRGLMRRIKLDYNSRVTFPDFAQILRPHQIDSYIERIE